MSMQMTPPNINSAKDRKGKPFFISVNAAEKWWIENARENPEIFIWYCLKLKPAAHHRIWLRMFFNPKNNLVNIVAPRESAKTTISLYAIAWLMAKNPSSTNAIVSVSAKQAEGRIAELKSLIAENPAFRNVFPHIKIDTRRPVTQTQFSIIDTSIAYSHWTAFHIKSMKDPTMLGLGAGGKGIIGQRISGVMLLDDIVDESEMSIAMQDKKERYIANTLMPCVQESGRIWNIGTRWMAGDIYGRYLENPNWASKVIPAILFDDEGKRKSYWPGYWPLKRLDKKKADMQDDVLFGIMYLCTAAETTLGLFPLELIDACIADFSQQIFKDKIKNLKALFVTSDFAVTAKTRSDWNVLYAVGLTQNNEYLALDGLRYKTQPTTNIDTIVDFCYRINATYGEGIGLTAVLTEKVAFQSIFAHFMAEKSSFLPIHEVVPMGDKDSRARPIRDYMLMERFWMSHKIDFIDIIRAEMNSLGFARHDDTVDPFSLLLQHTSRSHVDASYHEIHLTL
jgi:hypothetical protein